MAAEVHVISAAEKVFISTSCFKKLERGEKQETKEETMEEMIAVTLAELESEELRLQEQTQERLTDFTPFERDWFAKGEELSAEAERHIAARLEALPRV